MDHNQGRLPSQIVVYRDGVGGPTFQDKVIKYELGDMIDVFLKFDKKYKPKILYIFVDKRINTRFFCEDNGKMINPASGTVIDTCLVESQSQDRYDFYLIPHKATIATACPVHYRVAHNTTGLTKKQVEQYTFDQCFGYYNFMGPIKVPASVMYAHKIAYYSYDNKIAKINSKLDKKLHFL